MVPEPQNLVGQRLFCGVLDFRNGEVASNGETVRDLGENVELVVQFILLQDLLGLESRLSWEDGVHLCTGEKQWLPDRVKGLLGDE